jgi:hypothetical protein
VLGLLDSQRLIIDQHLEGLPPQTLIHIDPKVVEPNLVVLTDWACELAEPEDSPEAAGLDQAAFGIPEHHLWRHIIQPSLVIPPLVRPMPPELIVPHELRMLPIDRFPIRAPSVEYPRIASTDLGDLRLLAEFGESGWFGGFTPCSCFRKDQENRVVPEGTFRYCPREGPHALHFTN